MPTQLTTEAYIEASVIIPTFNRCASLLETLNSLAGQSLLADRYEVVVVDDGSTDDTRQVASMALPFPLRYLAQENQGAAAARNRGAAASRGKILVFIDDDITLDAGFLHTIVEAHRDEQKLVTMGVYQPFLTGGDSTFARYNARLVAAASDGAYRDRSLFVECSSNNVAIERHDFDTVGKWQDVFGDGPTLWGDVEFGYRAWKLGFRFLRVDGARLYHRDQNVRDLQAACRRAQHIGRTVHFLYRKHPEVAEHVPTFHDKEPVSLTEDSPRLVADKLFHAGTASPPLLWAMERGAAAIERRVSAADLDAHSRILDLLYRWIVSAYLYRGYRQGRRELAEPGP
ncbi:MAG: glycosyltransferase family 2 protein [Anaerolineae bacterium]|nr:glycosyltransferase family 2 protein [Anaerolineae bacterium]